MFKLFKKNASPKEDAAKQNPPRPSTEKKPSWYERYQSSKRGEINPDDVLKYTGRTKEQINEWAKKEPGVAGNQPAGKINMGGTSGLGGMSAAEGYGGWGPNANKLKFPSKQDKVWGEGGKEEGEETILPSSWNIFHALDDVLIVSYQNAAWEKELADANDNISVQLKHYYIVLDDYKTYLESAKKATENS